MAEQSHREEMSAAIRAQRERQAARASAAPLQPSPAEPESPAGQEPERAPRRGVLGRLLGR
jgi:hypothetical protein